ncbi:uncharacterized protein JCM15063_002494 [Sporobolomyces koalae]|uniref:uncharacterized protein n=1 Tax=Sporobolomyces koalae TaxID=500713 RepID=UPI00317EFF42
MSKAQRRRQSQAQTRDSPEPEDLERQQREEESEAIALEEEQTARRNLHRLGFTLPFKESQHVNLMDAYAVQGRGYDDLRGQDQGPPARG